MRKLWLLFTLFALPVSAQENDIRDYIKRSWTTLTRSHAQLLEAAEDPKWGERSKWTVYVSPKEDLEAVRKQLIRELPADKLARIDLKVLTTGDEVPEEPGLLYLPRPYVVPGGRFNEMYGWDSYFIELGLLRDKEVQKARDIVLNFLYEVEHYGKVLNANRSYYLTRSQPPFLSRMVLAIGDPNLEKRAWPALVETYKLWTTPPHQPSPDGLSRYWDFGEGPAPEVIAGERDASGKTHYDRIREHFQTMSVDLSEFYDRAQDRLTPAFYKGDRSMRESGFDPSNRFGPFNVDVVNYSPVDLNTLLWVYEKDMAHIAKRTGHPSAEWEERARQRAEKIHRLLWDEKEGLFLDYRFPTRERRVYPFGTTFFPLWAGLATPEQARRVRDNLKIFERPGGLLTSPFKSGNQWDAPFGWAPLQLIAEQGLRRYGYHDDADRISLKWLSMVKKEFERTGTIVEKYDVERRSTQVSEGIQFGYNTNEIGFGWTNAAYLIMADDLTPAARQKL